jgi:PAS domain S-box-containing protein
MAEKKRLIIGITILFLCGGGMLYFLDTLEMNRAGEGELPFTLWSVLILAFMFAGVLALLGRECLLITKKIERYERDTEEADRSLQVAQADFNETVERRTFEISVINASLNREIAERMQAETEGKKLQHRMELILECAGEGIFGLDSNGNVTFANKAASEMIGWMPEELVGKSHHNLVHHTHSDGTVYPVEECPIHMAYKDGKVHCNSDDVFWTRDGRSFHVEYISTPIMENNRIVGAVIVFSDITGRLRADRESKKIQRLMELILDSAGDGIFGLDVNGNVTFTNKAASLMLGWSPEELVGKPHHNLVHHTHSDGSPYPVQECPIHMAYKDGKVHFNSNDVFWCKDGASFPVEYVSTPIEEDGTLTGAVVVFRDSSLSIS